MSEGSQMSATPVSGQSDAFLWPLWALHACGAQTYRQKVYTYIILKTNTNTILIAI